MNDLTPEERCERVRMALAEAGYPDVEVAVDRYGVLEMPMDAAPDDVRWRAFVLADPHGTECWPCWSAWESGTGYPNCDHDPLTSPWPEVVR